MATPITSNVTIYSEHILYIGDTLPALHEQPCVNLQNIGNGPSTLDSHPSYFQ